MRPKLFRPPTSPFVGISPTDQRELLTEFRATGMRDGTFDNVCAVLRSGSLPLPVKVCTADRIFRGYAQEVDESGILRITSIGHPDRGVRVLVSRENGKLYGEFAE